MNDNSLRVIEVDINEVLPNRFQPRIQFDEDEILELSDSIKEHGVIQPLIVRTIGDKYEIIAGERRYKASVLAGKETVPVIVKNLNDKESAEIALIENVQRKSLTPIEEALSYKNILDMGYLTQETLAQKIGKSQASIANKIRLLNLSDEVQEALLENKISERHARSLLKLRRSDDQNRMLERIISERMTVRKTDEEISKMLYNDDSTESDDSQKIIERRNGESDMNNNMDFNTFGVAPQPAQPSFDAFGAAPQSAQPSFDTFGAAPQPAQPSFDAFGAAPQPAQPSFDAFGAAPQPAQPSFDAFGAAPQPAQPSFDAFGAAPQPAQPSFDAFGAAPQPAQPSFDAFGAAPQPAQPSFDAFGVAPQPAQPSFDANPEPQPVVQPDFSSPSVPETAPIQEFPSVSNEGTQLNENDSLFGFGTPAPEVQPASNQQPASEPIIVTDYSKQYDPVMPQSESFQQSKVDFKEVIAAIRDCSSKIEQFGYKIDVEEYDLNDLYQVVFKIDK